MHPRSRCRWLLRVAAALSTCGPEICKRNKEMCTPAKHKPTSPADGAVPEQHVHLPPSTYVSLDKEHPCCHTDQQSANNNQYDECSAGGARVRLGGGGQTGRESKDFDLLQLNNNNECYTYTRSSGSWDSLPAFQWPKCCWHTYCSGQSLSARGLHPRHICLLVSSGICGSQTGREVSVTGGINSRSHSLLSSGGQTQRRSCLCVRIIHTFKQC